MAGVRRVVTGYNTHGKSVVAEDSTVEGQPVPGMQTTVLTTIWGADAVSRYPNDGHEPAYHDYFPPIGGVRLLDCTLAPQSAAASEGEPSNDVVAETERLFPGLLEHFDASDPGMHRSATTDMIYVIAGRCVLELDDGSKTELRAGDTVIQNGTMHRWLNPYDEPCRFLAALVGATLDPG